MNLGCGRGPLEGYWNVDLRPGPGVDQTFDVMELPWPFADSSLEEVRADNLLEHLEHWERLMPEFARVLQADGILRLHVPYKLVGFRVPWHIRLFWPSTFDPFCDNTTMTTAIPFVRHPFVAGSLEWEDSPRFSMVSKRYRHLFPFSWHIAERLGLGERVYYWPLGRRLGMEIILRRNHRVAT